MKFNFGKIKPDGILERQLEDGGIRRIPMYTEDTQHRMYGRRVFEQIVKACPEDLDEGPTTKALPE